MRGGGGQDDAGSRGPREGSFGDLLSRHRASAGLMQEELAERAQMSVRGVRYLEQGGGSGTLPRPAGPLIGRDREVAALSDLLNRDDVRLLTLTGAGGVGKTRLAVEVAGRLRQRFSGEVVWVPLASLADAALVPASIARALGLSEPATLSLPDALTGAMRDRPVLLVLDNFEHLAPAADLVTELLASCPSSGHWSPAARRCPHPRRRMRRRCTSWLRTPLSTFSCAGCRPSVRSSR
jgi:hypothetical protein